MVTVIRYDGFYRKERCMNQMKKDNADIPFHGRAIKDQASTRHNEMAVTSSYALLKRHCHLSQ